MTVISFPNLDSTGACNEFLSYNFLMLIVENDWYL